MRNKGDIEKQIRRLERSIRKFGDRPEPGQDKGPKAMAIEELKKGVKHA